jgi:indolepyruvate ferredoxin oxidoreductase alpha subunit
MVSWADDTPFNKASGKGIKGIIGVGFAHRKLLDVVGDQDPEEFRLLKLGVLYPLPRNIITEFLQDCHEVLVVEENEPYLEIRIKAMAHDIGSLTQIHGKHNKRISREGELFRWQIQLALSEFIPESVPVSKYEREKEAEERPEKQDYCADCQYDKILDKLEKAAESLGQKPMLIGDPGCLVTVADRLDAKYALGSAVSVADGLSKAGIDERAVAIFGDSSFFHTTLPAICNAVHNQSKILMVVLDNKATATSGFQVNPGVGRDALGRETPALDIEKIARACGVKHVYTSGLDDSDPTLEDTFWEALSSPELTLVVVRIESPRRR